MQSLQKYNKFYVALIGAVAQVVAIQFPNSVYSTLALVVIATLTAMGVYVVPNK